MRALLAVLVLCIGIALFLYAPNASAAEGNVPHVDAILVEKQQHRLFLLHEGKPLKTYTISIGRSRGRKVWQGDEKTPEGHYVISGRNPNSRFHRSLHISYPNADDIARAKKLGLSPGGDIMIHGIPNSMGWLGNLLPFVDWTTGCIAVTNEEIDEIWNLVADGTPVDIEP